MNKTVTNIYKFARLCSGLTQEHASEKLGISTRLLSDFENGKKIPHDDIVCTMINIYDSVWLAYQHLKLNTSIGQKYLPSINLDDLSLSVLRFQKEYNDIKKVQSNMIEIACDGKIDIGETIEWDVVSKEINELASAALSIMFIK